MSDSGRQIGGCYHGRSREWCVICLREDVSRLEDEKESTKKWLKAQGDLFILTDWRDCPSCGKSWPHPALSSHMSCYYCHSARAAKESAEAHDRLRSIVAEWLKAECGCETCGRHSIDNFCRKCWDKIAEIRHRAVKEIQ